MKRHTLALIMAVLLTLSSIANGENTAARRLVLIDQGVCLAPIVVFQDVPPRTHDAAVTLADYLEKISGTRPDLIEGAPQPVPEHAIWIGYQPVLKTLLPAIDFEFQHPEEILIAANENHLVIAGRDRWDPNHMEAKGRLAQKTGLQQEYGTANAVYTFLQDYLHVRWLWPGEIGEDLLPQKTIAFEPFQFRYHPQIRSRSGMFVRLSLGDNKEGPDELWTRYQRVQLNSLELAGGHAFGHWWDKYHEQHPEYFALQPDGTRSPHPTPNNTKLCDTNPAVWQQWLTEVEEALKADPTRRVFNVSPNDGYDFGHCVCEKCLAWDHPDGKKFTWRWRGKQEEWPALSDRQVTFANTLARMLENRFPDRQLFVQLHAYGYSRPAPIAAVPDENVIISSVANFHMRGDGVRDTRTESMEQFAAWAEKAPHLAWRPNLGNPVGLQWGMPDVAMKHAAQDFRFVADHHCIGLFFDMFWFHWATQGPHYYLLAHLAWNPNADAAAVMDDYYTRGFGPAHEAVKAYWDLMEDTRQAVVEEVPNRHRAYEIPKYYTPQLLAHAEALLDQAVAKVADDPEIYRQRIEFLRAGLQHTRLVVDTRKWMQRVEESKGKDPQAVARVLANWEKAAEMRETLPAFAVNYQAVFHQPMNKRMMGLHPGNLLSGRVMREAQMRGLE